MQPPRISAGIHDFVTPGEETYGSVAAEPVLERGWGGVRLRRQREL